MIYYEKFKTSALIGHCLKKEGSKNIEFRSESYFEILNGFKMPNKSAYALGLIVKYKIGVEVSDGFFAYDDKDSEVHTIDNNSLERAIMLTFLKMEIGNE